MCYVSLLLAFIHYENQYVLVPTDIIYLIKTLSAPHLFLFSLHSRQQKKHLLWFHFCLVGIERALMYTLCLKGHFKWCRNVQHRLLGTHLVWFKIYIYFSLNTFVYVRTNFQLYEDVFYSIMYKMCAIYVNFYWI